MTLMSFIRSFTKYHVSHEWRYLKTLFTAENNTQLYLQEEKIIRSSNLHRHASQPQELKGEKEGKERVDNIYQSFQTHPTYSYVMKRGKFQVSAECDKWESCSLFLSPLENGFISLFFSVWFHSYSISLKERRKEDSSRVSLSDSRQNSVSESPFAFAYSVVSSSLLVALR